MDIWSLLHDITGGALAPGSSSSYPARPVTPFTLLIDDGDFFDFGRGGFTQDTLRDWLVSRSLELDERHVQPIDVNAVLGKCRKDVYKPKGKAEADQQNECPVCLEKFVLNDQLLVLPCNHRFHSDCLTPWIKSNHGLCPCCRADIRGMNKTSKAVPELRRSGNINPDSRSNMITARPGRIDPGIFMRNDTGRPAAANNPNRFNTFRRGAQPDDFMSTLADIEAAMNRLSARHD